MNGCIYMVSNLKNGEKYVGQTINFKSRKYSHLNLLRYDNHYNKHLQRSFTKYGEEAFKWDILEDEIKTKEELNEREIFFINFYDSYENGYNQTKGGEDGSHRNKLSPEDGLKILITLKFFANKQRELFKIFDLDRKSMTNILNRDSYEETWKIFDSLSENQISKISEELMIEYGWEVENLIENTTSFLGKRSISKEEVFTILSVVDFGKNMEKTICEILNVSPKSIYMIKNKETYLDFSDEYSQFSLEEKKIVWEESLKKYPIHETCEKRKSKVSNGNGTMLTKEQCFEAMAIRKFSNTFYSDIGLKYGKSEATIRDLCNGRTHKARKIEFDNMTIDEQKKYISPLLE